MKKLEVHQSQMKKCALAAALDFEAAREHFKVGAVSKKTISHMLNWSS